MSWEILNDPENKILKKKRNEEKKEIFSMAPVKNRLPFLEQLKTLPRKERKKILNNRKFSKKKMDENFEQHPYRKAFIKNTFNIRNVVVISLVTLALMYPSIERYFIERNISKLDIEDRPPVELVCQDELSFDKNGLIIEKPITSQELFDAQTFMEEKLFDDLEFVNSNIKNVDKIIGIYKHKLYNENYEKNDSLINVVFESNSKLYSLGYNAFEEDLGEEDIGFELGLNDAETLLNFMTTLQSCYICDMASENEAKEDLTKTFDAISHSKHLVGNIILYNEGTLEAEYQVPVFTDNGCVVYSVSESDLATHSMNMTDEDIYNLLNNFLKNENELFTTTKLEKVKNSDEISSAFKNGKQNEENMLKEMAESKTLPKENDSTDLSM